MVMGAKTPCGACRCRLAKDIFTAPEASCLWMSSSGSAMVAAASGALRTVVFKSSGKRLTMAARERWATATLGSGAAGSPGWTVRVGTILAAALGADLPKSFLRIVSMIPAGLPVPA